MYGGYEARGYEAYLYIGRLNAHLFKIGIAPISEMYQSHMARTPAQASHMETDWLQSTAITSQTENKYACFILEYISKVEYRRHL